MELDDQLTLGKKRFNVNSVSSRPANHEIRDKLYKKETAREKQKLNVLTGNSIEFTSNKNSNGKRGGLLVPN